MAIDALTEVAGYWMDLTGIFAFAMSGAFVAVRKDFGVFGVLLLAEAAGLGGGLFRDLIIGVVPVAFIDCGYYLTPVAAALVVFFSSRVHRHGRLLAVIDVCDTAALALFGVSGAVKALGHDFGRPSAIALGVASAVGGGILSSVLAREVPPPLRWEQDLYVLPAVTGAGSAILLDTFGVLNGITAPCAAVPAFGLGLLATRRRWRTPRARIWRNPFSGMRHQPSRARTASTADSEKTQSMGPFDEWRA
ncbi:putative membrane protein YeiH [Thermocatellispora tengchongensis]|uniref:Putative membrane protein YeiH n=1 Tax=Thermocatellispora tengchongensis TaxID=1073253 RepID=A0A840PXM8_9ACTN|nr:TRIC cation channel family protein [Thermocatellispora tengchongensis]MBB5140605.1 putative membrane protein YeiH [Thermocatellispora tengchongensis]